MFDRHYIEWNQKRIQTIITFFGGASYFQGKTILDCAGGHGDIGAAERAHILCLLAQNLRFDTCQVVFRQLCNLLEEFAAAIVV